MHTCGYTYNMDTHTQNTCTHAYTHSLVTQTVKNLAVMPETQVPSLGQADHLEKGMAAHWCILAWRIPWIGEPGGLQSMGLLRVDTAQQLTVSHHFHAQYRHLNLEFSTPVFLDGKAATFKLFSEFMERVTWATFPPDLRTQTALVSSSFSVE